VFEHAGEYARKFIAPWALITRTEKTTVADALDVAKRAGLTMPFIAKPDLGCRGTGVRRVRTEEELKSYIDGFPPNERIVFQALVDHEPEAGIFYVRKPSEPRGRIISITLKYFPYVYGNGTSTLRELIASTGSCRRANRSASPMPAATVAARSFATATTW
jgi:hypothetical protein